MLSLFRSRLVAPVLIGLAATANGAEPSAAEQVASRAGGVAELKLYSLLGAISTDTFKLLSCALGKDEASNLLLATLEAPLEAEAKLWIGALAKEYEKRFTPEELEMMTVRKAVRPYLFRKLQSVKEEASLALRPELSVRASAVAAKSLEAAVAKTDPAALKVDRSSCKP